MIDFTGIALIITAIGSATAAIISALNGRKLTDMATKVESVHQATNSMKDELVRSARTEGHAAGVQQERDDVAARKETP